MKCFGLVSNPEKILGLKPINFLDFAPNKSLLQSLGLSSTQQFARYLSNSWLKLHHAGKELNNQKTRKYKLKTGKNAGLKIRVSKFPNFQKWYLISQVSKTISLNPKKTHHKTEIVIFWFTLTGSFKHIE